MHHGDNGYFFKVPDCTSFPLGKTEVKQGICTAMFRPQNLRIVRNKKISNAGNIQLSGIVKHCEFLGSRIRYTILVGEQNLLVDDTHEANCSTMDLGEIVLLQLERDLVRILPS